MMLHFTSNSMYFILLFVYYYVCQAFTEWSICCVKPIKSFFLSFLALYPRAGASPLADLGSSCGPKREPDRAIQQRDKSPRVYVSDLCLQFRLLMTAALFSAVWAQKECRSGGPRMLVNGQGAGPKANAAWLTLLTKGCFLAIFLTCREREGRTVGSSHVSKATGQLQEGRWERGQWPRKRIARRNHLAARQRHSSWQLSRTSGNDLSKLVARLQRTK